MILLKNRTGIILSAFALFTAACTNDNSGTPVPTPTIVKEWNIPMSAQFESPAPAGRTETGTSNLKLMSDNSLQYNIAVSGLTGGDVLNAAHLHAGDAITSGPVILSLNPVFTAGNSTGIVSGLRSSLIDSLKNSTNDIYINAHSSQVGAGLVRGQLNTNIELAADLAMSPANEVPAGTSAATGLGLLRLTSDKKAYLKITVTGLEANDTLTAAHIHKAATGVNGPIILPFYADSTEFGKVKIVTVDDALFASLKTDPIYMNAHSKRKPGGIIRAQIR